MRPKTHKGIQHTSPRLIVLLARQSEGSHPGVPGRPVGPDASPAAAAGGRAGRGREGARQGPGRSGGVHQEGPGHALQAHVQHHASAPVQEKGPPALCYGGSPAGPLPGLGIHFFSPSVCHRL